MKKSYHIADNHAKLETATFAGGCFWCVEAAFVVMPGIISVTSGYAGGKEKNPSYEAVCSGETGHVEAVQIIFDKRKTSYQELLDLFWRQIDPTDGGGQFADRGKQYKPIIFYHNSEQKKLAGLSKKKIQEMKKFDRPIAIQILPFTSFYPAEDYHQQYYKKNPLGYKMYRMGSGRDAFLKGVWGENGQV